MLCRAEERDEFGDPANGAESDIVGRTLYDDCAEGEAGLFAERFINELSESGRTRRGALGDGVEEVVVNVEGEWLLESVCWVSEKERKKETVLGICGDDGREVGGAD